jgi:hypothetical protein
VKSRTYRIGVKHSAEILAALLIIEKLNTKKGDAAGSSNGARALNLPNRASACKAQKSTALHRRWNKPTHQQYDALGLKARVAAKST